MIPDLTENELITLRKRMLFYGEIALKGIEEIQLHQFWWYNFKCIIQHIKNSEWFNKLIVNIKPDPYYIENGSKNPTEGPIHFLALKYFFLDDNELEPIFKEDPEFENIMVMNSDLVNYMIENFPENIENGIFVNDAAAREKQLKNKINLKIESLINEIDKNKGWESLFFEEKDYHEFRDILIKFFSEPNFEIPTTTIKTKPKTIGKVSILLKGIHEHFSEMTGHLIKDERFHHVVKILHEWKDRKPIQIYKAIYKG